jgi:hypothetical protein
MVESDVMHGSRAIFIRKRRIRRVGLAVSLGKVFVGKSEGKRLLGRFP